MMNSLRYLKIQLTRAFKLFPAIAAVSGVLLLAIGVGFSAMFADAEEQTVKINVGIVGDLTEDYLGIGLYALQHMDSSRYSVEFIPMNEEEAHAQVFDRSLSGYVLIPDGFVSSILRGENQRLAFVSADRTDTLAPALMRTVAECASRYVTESQSGIYAMQAYARSVGIDGEPLWDATERLNLDYFDLVFTRSRWCAVEQIGAMGTVSFGGYYLCAFLLLFLLLFSVMSAPLLSGKRVNAAYFRSRGTGGARQVVCEYFSYLCLMLVILAVTGAVTAFFLPDGLVGELSGGDVAGMLMFLLRCFPAAALISALQILLWEAVLHTVSGAILQFVFAIGFGYITGCFYPVSFFPDSVQALSRALPTGCAMHWMQAALTGTAKGGTLLLIISECATALFLACVIRIMRLRKGGGE